jgi:hypothetical protein
MVCNDQAALLVVLESDTVKQGKMLTHVSSPLPPLHLYVSSTPAGETADLPALTDAATTEPAGGDQDAPEPSVIVSSGAVPHQPLSGGHVPEGPSDAHLTPPARPSLPVSCWSNHRKIGVGVLLLCVSPAHCPQRSLCVPLGHRTSVTSAPLLACTRQPQTQSTRAGYCQVPHNSIKFDSLGLYSIQFRFDIDPIASISIP